MKKGNNRHPVDYGRAPADRDSNAGFGLRVKSEELRVKPEPVR
jgi:hypothetical protein